MSIIYKTILISSLFLASLAQAQEYSQVREQYYFNLVFKHKNKDGKEFGSILSKKEISFVSRFVLIAAYLHKLESDMRQAGDHLLKSL